MPIIAFRTNTDWALASLTGGAHPVGDALTLAPHDLTPNSNWREIDEEGTAVGWVIEQGVIREGTHHYVSRAGNRPPGATVPSVETEAPKRDSLVRQTPDALPMGEAWSAFQSLIYGFTPQWTPRDASVLPRPDPPEIEIVDRGKQGFPDDRYGVRIDLRPKEGGRTTPSGFTFIEADDFATGNHFRIYTAEYMGGAAVEIGVYVTRPGTGGRPGTERQVGVYNLYRAADKGYINVHGPYRDNGRRPAKKDESGIGTPVAPVLHNSKRKFHVVRRPARFNLQQGRYRFAIQKFNGRGWSMVGDWSPEVRVEGQTVQVPNPNAGEEGEPDTIPKQLNHRIGQAFWIAPPPLPPGTRWRPWVQKRPLNQGPIQILQGYHALGNKELEGSFGDFRNIKFRGRKGRHSRGIGRFAVPFYGYNVDNEPSGLQVRFADSSYPTEDESGVEPPSPEEGPQVEAVGKAFPDVPATYFVGASEEDNVGRETVISSVVRVPSGGTLGSNETWRQKPTLRTNQIRNAEGAERDATSIGATTDVPDWNGLVDTATATAGFEDGLLYIRAIASGGAAATPTPNSDPIAVNVDEDVAFMATMYATDPTLNVEAFSGGSELVVEHYSNTNGTGLLATTVICSLAAAGSVVAGPRGFVIGPNGDVPWDDSTQSCRVRLRPDPAGGTWNMNLYAKDMLAMRGGFVIRKWESLGPNLPANFAPNPGVAYPHSSGHAVGPVPEAESQSALSDPPIFTTDFEGGNFAAWSQQSVGGNQTLSTQNFVTGANALEGTTSHKLASTGTNKISTRWHDRSISGAQRQSLHMRWLDRLDELPNKGKGVVRRAQIIDQNGNFLCLVAYSNGQLRLYRYKNDGTTVDDDFVVGVDGLQEGQLLDVELGVTGGGTSGGMYRLLVGMDGNTRTEVARISGQNLVGKNPRKLRFGARETSSGATWQFTGDNIVVTEFGYILNPEEPVNLAAVEPDAPILEDATPTYRMFDAEGQALNQWFWFNEQDVPLPELGGGPRIREPISVVPGTTYTQAVQMAWHMTNTSDEPSHQFCVVLTGDGKEPLIVGSPFAPGPDATLCSRAAGARDSADGQAEEGDWSATPGGVSEDYYQIFTIPNREDEFDNGYTEAWIEPVNPQSGAYVAQEHLFAVGAYNTQAERDGLRDYGVAVSGSVTLTFDTYTPDGPEGLTMPLRDAMGKAEFLENDEDLPSGVRIQNPIWRAADAEELLATAIARSNPENLHDARFYRLSFDLASNGEEAPEVQPGNAYVYVKPFMSTLLTEDRQEFVGGTFVDGVEAPPERQRTEITELHGAYLASARSQPVRFMTELAVHCFSEEGKLAIEEHGPTDLLAIEAPFIGGTGTVYIIEPGQDITFDTDPNSVVLKEARARLRRYVHGVATITAARVVEEAPLE